VTPDRLRQIQELYHSAREREPGQRTAFLTGACKDDEDLLREVESLLAADPTDACFLDEPVMRQAAEILASQQSRSQHQFVPGLELGPYVIEAHLGAGGMGEVYRAKDKRLHRTVALKVLPQRLAHTPGLRQRLEREAKAISSLNHPHICTLYDIGREGEVDYLVMEFLEGDTLAQQLKRGALPLSEVLELAAAWPKSLSRSRSLGSGTNTTDAPGVGTCLAFSTTPSIWPALADMVIASEPGTPPPAWCSRSWSMIS